MSKSMTRDERYSPNNRQIKREESRMFKNRQKYSHLKDDEEPKRE